MRKHDSLCAALHAAFPDLAQNPASLSVYIDKGHVATRMGAAGRGNNGGFEWQYTLTAIMLGFTQDLNTLAATVLEWMRTHQPDRLQNHTQGDEAFTFEVDILDDDSADVIITIELTEAVDIAADGTMAYREEPTIPSAFTDVPASTTLDSIILSGEALHTNKSA